MENSDLYNDQIDETAGDVNDNFCASPSVSPMGPPRIKPVVTNLSACGTPLSDSSGKNSSDSSGKLTEPSPDTSTPSSSDTVPVSEDAQENTAAEGLSQPKIWGIAHAIQPEFFHLDLSKDRYTFGRAKQCDYSFDIPSIKTNKYHKLYSKMHFALERTVNEDGSTNKVILEDLGGTNGTFVNSEKVASFKQRCIQNHDKIALAYCWNTVFLFIDNNSTLHSDLPPSFSNKYIMHKRIGKGACGEVFEVWLKEGVFQYACKVISKSRLSTIDNSRNYDIMKEAKLLQNLCHPCIIGVEDIIDSPKSLYLVLEYAAGGDLFERLASKGPLPERIAKLYFYQMLHAVSYLHGHGITHRDLKPENILLMTKDEPSLLKITDFGMSRLVRDETLMMTLTGTPSYIAPEIIKRINSQSNPGYTKQVDMWSLGVLLYVCLVAYPPFSNDRTDTLHEINDQIMTANFNFNNSRWAPVSPSAKQLVTFLLKLNANQRLNTSEALNHLWLDDATMLEQADQLMKISFKADFNLIGEKSLSNDSFDTRKISTDVDGEGCKNGSSLSKSDSDEFALSGVKRFPEESDENVEIKQMKMS